jgi:hypothetical protein
MEINHTPTDHLPEPKLRWYQYSLRTLLLFVTLFAIVCSLFTISFRYLPCIGEMPPWGSDREGKNWIGQGGWAFVGFTILLLLVAYSFKRTIVIRCSTKGNASKFFFLFIMLSLPYIWFFCEPDWFNRFIYRISCWIGGPIDIWFVPTISFLVDLYNQDTPKSLKKYIIRSAVEVLVIFPVWTVFWAFFSFFVLGWGWI